MESPAIVDTQQDGTLPVTKTSNISIENLMLKYKKLKSKYDSKIKENKILKDSLESAMTTIKTFEESSKSINTIYSQVKELVANFKSPSTNQDFSTSDFSQFQRSSLPKTQDNLSNNNTNNQNFMKRFEDFESHYSEMSKNFNNLVIKYKMLKEDKIRIEDSSLKILNRYSQLEKQHDDTIKELYSRYEEIKRFKDIDRCLVDYTLNSFMLKIDPRDSNKNTQGMNDPGIKCEPLPTFAKFLVNKKFI